MKKKLSVIVFTALVAMAVSAKADTFILSGDLLNADQVGLHSIYVGGSGAVVSMQFTSGNFDSVFSLFDSAGKHIITNDDSPFDGKTLSTNSHITASLGPGSYILAVTVCCNFSTASDAAVYFGTDGYNFGSYWIGGNGNLSDGFFNFGCAENCGGAYEVTVSSPSEGTISAVPEPGSLVLMGTGLTGLAGRLWRNRKRT